MPRLLFAFLLTVAATAATQTLDKWEKIVAFEKHWNPYVRKYVGCPLAGEASQFTCNPRLGAESYRDFKGACHAAAKLFGLKDTCED